MAILVFSLSFLLYLITLAPSVVTLFDDSLEFQLVTYQLGIAHPTGYPLYTLLGKLFTFLPVGNVAFRVNVMSAFFGAATIALLYLVILRTIKSDWRWDAAPAGERFLQPATLSHHAIPHVAAILGASFLAVSPIFWRQATIAEVYTLNAVFIALILYVALRSFQSAQSQVVWLSLLVGLSLTHHRTMVLLLPALVLYLYLLFGKTLFQPKTLTLALVSGLLPLLLYLYLPLRGHIGSLDGTYENSWAGFWQHVGGGGYGTTFLLGNPFGHDRGPAFYWTLLTDQFYTLVPGAIGMIYLLWRKQRLIGLTGLAFLSYLGFNLGYQVSDIDVFFIPVILILALWSGVGLVVLLHFIARMRQGIGRYGLSVLLIGYVGFGLTQQIQTQSTTLREAYTWRVHDYGLDMLQQPLPSGAVGGSTIIGIVGEMTLLRYFQQTEHLRPDIETIAADAEAARISAIEQALAEGRAVYLTRELPGLAERWSLSAVGPLIRVNPADEQIAPEPSIVRNTPVTPEITLRGYDLSRPSHTGQGPAPVRLSLVWVVEAQIQTDLKVSARLLDPAGEVVAVTDAGPVHFAYPTSRWRLGETVTDGYTLDLPPDLPGGTYTPLIIWYDPAQEAAEVGRVELEPISLGQ